jgi:outer membrane protein assembly factor BamB
MTKLPAAAVGVMCVAMLLLGAAKAWGQFGGARLQQRAQFAPRFVRPAPAAKPDGKATTTADELAEKKFRDPAALKTDPEQQRLLQRAEICLAEKRLDLAAVLWQKVLDEAGDTLMTRDGERYTSLAEEVELSLIDPGTPPLALATYRITADGEAQAILSRATPDKQEEALGIVVRRFFLSSHGDDAAYKLACLALDRYDFVGASRLLTKILERYPDPSVPRGDILLRLAVASARMGDRETAEAALAALNSEPGIKPPSSVITAVDNDIKLASLAASGIASASPDWHMQLGNAARNGAMPALPSEATRRTLTELWVQETPPSLAGGDNNPVNVVRGGGGIFGGGMVIRRSVRGGAAAADRPLAFSREQLVAEWRQNGWMPTQQLLFDGGRVYIKSQQRLGCFSATAHSDQPLWLSAWENQYELDGMSQMLIMMAQNSGLSLNMGSKPRSPAEILLFGDRVQQSMSIAGGVIYSLEGKQIKPGEKPQAANQRGVQWGVTPRRTRTNWLAAYKASGGNALWRRAASDEDKEHSQDVGFLAAPVPYGNLLIAPVTDGGTIWLYALSAANGTTVWKSYLCDEPAGGCSPWSAVTIAVDGRDAYLTCGTGVVFAVDAVSGAIRWAMRYQRDGEANNQLRNAYGMQQSALTDPVGWDDDVVVTHGRTLVVMSSDCDRLLALDRRTGALRWDSPRTSPFGSVATYCLGAAGDRLYVAGKNVVRCYGVSSGLLKWETEIDNSYGRGVLTGDAIYVPVKDSIVKLDLASGRELLQVGASLTTDEPIGNLYSDGEKLWVVGAGRVYAMTNIEHRLHILQEQIAAGDAEAQLNRMRIYAKEQKLDLALADLRGAYELFRQQDSDDIAAQRLFAAMNELKLPQRQPQVALQMLVDVFLSAQSPPELAKEVLARRGDLLSSTLHVIRQEKLSAAVPVLLKIAPLLEQEYLVNSTAQTLDLVASKTPATIAALQSAVQGPESTGQILAAAALARLEQAAAREDLEKLIAAKDDRVRLAGARALANLGERSVLETLVKLLESESPRVRARAQQSLRALTGQSIAFAAEGKTLDRAVGVASWKEWVDGPGKDVSLKLPLSYADVPLGRILFVSNPQNVVVEFDDDHHERWRKQVVGPWGCQGLPNGNRLVGSMSQRAVLEFDETGAEVWRKDGLPAPPFSVQRLDNGNTLVACADANQIVEISPDGEIASFAIAGRPIFARRLENGHTLIALQQGNRVVELDEAKQPVWEARGLNGPCCATRLDNGNTLVVQQFTSQVTELDPSGQKTVWTCRVPLSNPTCAERLPSGHTLISDARGIREIDSAGEQVRWHHQFQNASSVSSF